MVRFPKLQIIEKPRSRSNVSLKNCMFQAFPSVCSQQGSCTNIGTKKLTTNPHVAAILGSKMAQVDPSWPRWTQDSLKGGHVGSKLARSWLQVGPSWPKLAQDRPKLAPNWPQFRPSCTQVGSSWLKVPPVNPKLAPRCSQWWRKKDLNPRTGQKKEKCNRNVNHVSLYLVKRPYKCS